MDVSNSESFSCGNLMPPPQEPPMDNQSSSKQSSIFSLTLEEFRTKSGKSFGSMNFEDFLESILGEENQTPPNPTQIAPTNYEDGNKQTSLPPYFVPSPHCGKTIDEVWFEIHKGHMEQQQNPNASSDQAALKNHAYSNLANMTLEDFLVKAGVICQTPALPPEQVALENMQTQCALENMQTQCANVPSNNTTTNCVAINVAPGQVLCYSEFPGNTNCGGNNLLGEGSSMYQVFQPTGGIVGEAPPTNNIEKEKSNSATATDVNEPSRRKRARMCQAEVAQQRRQRRMIKNRESAARSRARKQAYTMELEIELNKLKDENEKLKLALAEAESKLEGEQEMEAEEPTMMDMKQEKNKTICRTSSFPW